MSMLLTLWSFRCFSIVFLSVHSNNSLYVCVQSYMFRLSVFLEQRHAVSFMDSASLLRDGKKRNEEIGELSLKILSKIKKTFFIHFGDSENCRFLEMTSFPSVNLHIWIMNKFLFLNSVKLQTSSSFALSSRWQAVVLRSVRIIRENCPSKGVLQQLGVRSGKELDKTVASAHVYLPCTSKHDF